MPASRRVLALVRPAARPPDGVQVWSLGVVDAWTVPSELGQDELARVVVALGVAHLGSPVLPLRYGAPEPGPDALAAALGDLAAWRAWVDLVEGTAELGVSWPAPSPRGLDGEGPGARWLRARAESDPALDAARRGDAAARAVGEALGPLPHGVRPLAAPPDGPARVAVLVSAAWCEEARGRLFEASRLTGPWAPASFVGEVAGPDLPSASVARRFHDLHSRDGRAEGVRGDRGPGPLTTNSQR